MQIAGGTGSTGTGAAMRARATADLRAALAAAVKPDRNAVKSGAARTLASATMSGADWAKGQARARVQQIVERLKVLKKLFAADPRKMARALAEVFKELKAAVKAYGKATGEGLGAAGSAAGAALAAGGAPTVTADPKAEAASEPVSTPSPGSGDHNLYDAVVGEARKTIGEDGLQFVKTVRGLANEIKDLLETARTQARARKPDKDLTEAFEAADTALGELRDALSGMEADIHTAVPEAGMRLSMEA